MLKFKKVISSVLLAALIMSGMIMPVKAAAGDEIGEVSKDGVAFRFALIGDSHVAVNGDRKEYMEQAIKAFEAVGGVDAYGLNGDIVYYSKGAGDNVTSVEDVNTSNYDHVNSVLQNHGIGKDEGQIPFIASMGNHEFPESQNKKDICEAYVSAFENEFQQPLNYHAEYEGYNVIASGGRTYNLIDLADTNGDGVGDKLINSPEYYNTDEEWIMNEIRAIESAEDYNPDEPVFLMLHHAIQKTTCQTVNAMPQRYSAEFKAFLNERPNIVNLIGHTHAVLQWPETIWQDGFTVFQGSVTGTYGNANHQVQFIDVTEDNKVKIYKMDLVTNKFIGEPWEIDIPAGKEGFKYTDAIRKNTAVPKFAATDKITVDKTEEYSVTLTYPTGTCEETGELQDGFVAKHKITVTDKETTAVVSSKEYSAPYTTYPMPETITRTLTGLAPGTTYKISIVPVSANHVSGAAITGEFTTAGEKASVKAGEPTELEIDENLIGDIKTTVTENEDGTTTTTTTKSFEALFNGDSFRMRQGQYYTYKINVGEGEAVTEPGMYQVAHRYAVQKASAAIIMSVKHPDSEHFVPMVKRGLPSTGSHSNRSTVAKDDYITLKEGENTIKVIAYYVEGNDAVDMELPILSKVTEGGIVDYVTNKQVYNAVNVDDEVSGYGSITGSHIVTTGYQSYENVTFRKGDYIVVPVNVPYTAAYKVEASVKSTKSVSSTIGMAIGNELLDDWSALSYTNSISPTLTSSWVRQTVNEAVTLEAGKTYYFKVGATAVGDNHIAQIEKIRLTDTGAALSGLTMAGLSDNNGIVYPAFVGTTKAYTVYTSTTSTDITATPVDTSSTVIINGVEGAASGAATVTVSLEYGINNNIPVVVKNASGSVTGRYNINVIAAPISVVSLKDQAFCYIDSNATTATNVNELFDGDNANQSTRVVQMKSTGYIQVDLGEDYDKYILYKMVHRRGPSTSNKVLTVKGSNDPDFADGTEAVLGTSSGKEWTKSYSSSLKDVRQECTLNADRKYRYIRITAAGTIYPYRIDIYGFNDVTETVADDLTSTVSVPSQMYATGDSIIVAAYDESGKLVDAEITPAENAGTTSAVVKKAKATDAVKAMVWKDLDNMIPRCDSVVKKNK